MSNLKLSQQIFNHLMNGKIINRSKLANNSSKIENPLFVEIMQNIDAYRLQYQMCGYDFIENVDYIFIREKTENSNDLKTDLTMKICVLLLILAKFLNDKNYKVGKLTELSGGISKDEIDEMEQKEETQELLEKSKFKNGLFNAIEYSLIKRSILLEKPSSGLYILSESGVSFFKDIFNSYH